jgi:hypothetical protein
MIGYSHFCNQIQRIPSITDFDRSIIGKKYTVGHELGRGATSVVLYGISRADSVEVAIKCIFKVPLNSRRNLWRLPSGSGTENLAPLFLWKFSS